MPLGYSRHYWSPIGLPAYVVGVWCRPKRVGRAPSEIRSAHKVWPMPSSRKWAAPIGGSAALGAGPAGGDDSHAARAAERCLAPPGARRPGATDARRGGAQRWHGRLWSDPTPPGGRSPRPASVAPTRSSVAGSGAALRPGDAGELGSTFISIPGPAGGRRNRRRCRSRRCRRDDIG